MANLIHIERDQVRAACAAFKKLLAEDPVEVKEAEKRDKWLKAERARRDKEFAKTRPKALPKKRRTGK